MSEEEGEKSMGWLVSACSRELLDEWEQNPGENWVLVLWKSIRTALLPHTFCQATLPHQCSQMWFMALMNTDKEVGVIITFQECQKIINVTAAVLLCHFYLFHTLWAFP